MRKIISLLITAVLLISALLPGVFAEAMSYGDSVAKAETAAETLRVLGLMRGTGTDADGKTVYELNRPMTRSEAIAMLVRLVGGESAALSETRSTPFNDVESWAAPYVAYAYEKGYTKGVGEASFGGARLVTSSQYITFLLRVLGYTSEKDFKWDSPFSFSDLLGLTDGDYGSSSRFLRGDAALLSLAALSRSTKSGSSTLLGSLCESGAVSTDAAAAAGLSSLLGLKAMEAGEIYLKSRGALFTVKAFDASGKLLSSGTGFFADGGDIDSDYAGETLAVTSLGSLRNAASAEVTTFGGARYPVLGILAYGEAEDAAILRVGGSGFDRLSIRKGDAPAIGEGVFALGKDSAAAGAITYSGGLSNGVSYLRSSGGGGEAGAPLIDAYGKVAGVQSARADGLSLTAAALRRLTMTGFMRFSSERGYENAPEVPDFGAYFGFEPVKILVEDGETVFYYGEAAIRAVSPNAVQSYAALLVKWGFEYAGEREGRSFDYTVFKSASTAVTLGVELNAGVLYNTVRVTRNTERLF